MIWGHPSEEQFSKILDYKEIEWEYEPHIIVLKEKDGVIVKGFRPDFYLPQENLYIEITTAKNQSKKNRKMNLMAELHPDVNIMLISRLHLEHLLQKYNFLWSSE